MSETSNWAGSLSTTSAGTVIVEIIREGIHIEGTLRVFEPSIGRMEAQLTGEWDDENRLSAKLEQFRGSSNQAATLPQTGSIQGTYDPFDDVIKGVWQTDADTAGEFCWVKVAGQGLEKPDPATVASNGLLGPARQFAFNAKLLLDKRRRLVAR